MLVIVALTALAFTLPAFSSGAAADKTPAATAATAQAIAPAPCAQAQPDETSIVFEPLSGGSSKAEPSTIELLGTSHGGRTCRCSCGYPCKTDADCGGAVGSCHAGISCC
jgi:hypothetical protein